MGLTTALYTGLSGMSTNSEAISTTGNNIANANTTGFKSSRMNFETQISKTLSNGRAPTAELGGTNPSQVGHGARIGSVDRNFTGGALQPTGINTDMAIEGNGFFVLNVDGVQRFTRVGSFALDRDFNLTSQLNGGLVQGYGVDEDFNVIEGVLTNINIPIGSLTTAEATQEVTFTGNLNAGGVPAANAAELTSNTLTNGGGPAATAATLLDNIQNASATDLFDVGDIITITGIEKGGAILPDKTFEVGPANTTESDAFGTTLGDFTTFLNNILGIDESADPSAGITINGSGEIEITGNTGSKNDITITSGNIIVNQSTAPTLPFSFTKNNTADGESVRTSFVAYDSLGTAMTVDLTIVMENQDNTGTSWRFYVQSEDDTDVDRVLGTGTMAFDNNGRIISTANTSVTIDRDGTGAFSPQSIELTFDSLGNALSALTDTVSQVAALSQDGSPIGTLEDFTVGEDGTIVGVFSNSLLRDLGRITLAMFSNNRGLEDAGSSMFTPTVNSGTPAIVSPGSAGSGRVVGQALELSNVELSQEFISLITASTGFSASSRVLTTSDRLIQELLSTIR